jgi:S-adenosylmethionine hydrolase
LTTTGTYALEATDGNLASAKSSRFQVTPAAATRMVFIKSPYFGKHGKEFKVEVELLDKYGNVATNDTSSVTLSLGRDHKGAVLSGMLTAAVSNGIATFNNVSINQNGFFTLLATDSNGSLPAAQTPILLVGKSKKDCR